MPAHSSDKPSAEPFAPIAQAGAVLRLLVRNHPGVMSHVCGLFARRGFNVEAILCLPLADAARSTVWLLVNAATRVDQLTSQLSKLVDVLDVQTVPEGHGVFARVTALSDF